MKPLIGIVCDTKQQGLHVFHQAGEKYIRAIVETTDCTPLLIPAMPDVLLPTDILDHLDGVLLTGGYSNIARERYKLPPAPPQENQDLARDANNLTLIPAIIEKAMPLLAICRGFQEVNVAFGGSLHPRLQEVDGRFDHRENPEDPIETQYGPAHSITVATDGILYKLTQEREFMVNTLHGQGVNKLGQGLTVEAEADDGTIEALSVAAAAGFALALQWHPEWQAKDNIQSVQIFSAFGKAAEQYQSNNRRTI
ncbi:gamma-glutamyl-gamma-aminobutyrate hydrolase family protein [Kordiimonas aquimaris]|uniref:gamma-glutamyl-gamma-aminobutyrate hydrolase family protein n=1 Tax=Kordiimonas aquimaris TaxID=707591 RepID=UPI0021CFAE0C|nr:gamma-glutamyl-gamma-aminobutyrate hydrolase family protein [Kordiimonas aquimaris]